MTILSTGLEFLRFTNFLQRLRIFADLDQALLGFLQLALGPIGRFLLTVLLLAGAHQVDRGW